MGAILTDKYGPLEWEARRQKREGETHEIRKRARKKLRIIRECRSYDRK